MEESLKKKELLVHSIKNILYLKNKNKSMESTFLDGSRIE